MITLDHVGIDVNDLDAQVRFYQRAFDLSVEIDQDLPQFRFRYVMLRSADGWRVELFKRPGTTPHQTFDPDTQHNKLGIGHLALSVSDLETTYQRLMSLGAHSFIGPSASPEPSIQFAYLADPEGNLIELVDRNGQSKTSRQEAGT